MDPVLVTATLAVTVAVAWASFQFKRHRDKLFKLARLVEHPVIIKNINDMEMVTSISKVASTEHMKMTLFWVPLQYLCLALLALMLVFFDNGYLDYYEFTVPLASMIIAGYITAAIRFNFQPIWLVSAAMIVNKASMIHAAEQAIDQVVEDLIRKFEQIDGNKAAMQAEIDKIEDDPHAVKRYKELLDDEENVK